MAGAGRLFSVLLLGLVCQGLAEDCQLKEDAKELLSVAYHVDRKDTTYVDEIQVKMKDSKMVFTGLLEDGCEDESLKMTVSYKADGDETDWEEIKKKALTKRGARGAIKQKGLNPCAKYHVKITILNKDFEFLVGPYYKVEPKNYAVRRNNAYFETLRNHNNKHFQITGLQNKATIQLNQICAKTIQVEVYADEEQTVFNKTIQNDPENETVREIQAENLESCAEYTLVLTLSLQQTLDVGFDIEFDFQTMPSMQDLTNEVNLTETTLSWDFEEFFKADCADEVEVNTSFSLVIDGNTNETEAKGTKDFQETVCGSEVQLVAKYEKNGITESFTAYNHTFAKTSQDTMIEEDSDLVITLDSCQDASPTLEGLPEGWNTSSPIRLPLADVEWTGCPTHTVKIIRKEKAAKTQLFSEITIFNELDKTLINPGWANNKPDFLVKDITDSSATFETVLGECQADEFMVEVECSPTEAKEKQPEEEDVGTGLEASAEGNMQESEETPEEGNYDADEPSVVNNKFIFGEPLILYLKDNVNYTCKARLVKQNPEGRIVNFDESQTSEWSAELQVQTETKDPLAPPTTDLSM